MTQAATASTRMTPTHYPQHTSLDFLPTFYRPTTRIVALILESIYHMPSTISAGIRWQIDRNAGRITAYDLTTDKTNFIGKLYLHKPNEPIKTDGAILFLHGDFGHPFAYTPLIQAAQKTSQKPVFSIYLPYDNSTPQEQHRALFDNGIRKIQDIFAENGGVLKHLTFVGHSRGAIEAAHYAFHRQPKDVTVDKVISIAGRLKNVPSDPCHPDLQTTLDEVYQGILNHPEIPLFQIFGSNDSNAPKEAMAIRQDADHCFEQKNQGHLGIIYTNDTQHTLQAILINN